MIWFKRIFFILILLVVLAIASGIFINWKYGDDLKDYALETIRSTIETEVVFNEDVKISLWKDFPLVAVEIQDVYIQDSYQTDTLLAVEKAFVQFNLINIIQNKLTIEGIRVSDGMLRLKRNEQDQWNFRVWKTTDETKKKKTDFSIEILTLENIQLDYDDRMVGLNIQFLSHRSRIKGRFTDENQRLGLSLNGFIQKLIMVGKERVVSLPVSLAGVLNIRSKEKIYTVEMGNAIMADNEMVWDAEWSKKEDGMHMQLKIHASNIEPDVLLPHLWPQMPKNIKDLSLKGSSDLILTMNGPFTKTHGPELDATIRMRDGGLLFQNTEVSDLNFEGKLFMQDIKRSKAMRIAFESFNLKTPQGNVKGSGTLTDLTNPYLKLSTNGNSRLEEIITVADIGEDMQGSGNLGWNIDFEGPLGKDFNTTTAELRKMRWSGDVDLTETQILFNSGIPELKNLKATISMNGNETNVKNCAGEIGHLKFDGAIQIADFKDIMTEPDAPVNLKGNVHLHELDIVKLPEEWKFEGESSGARKITLNVITKVDLIRYHDFSATDISGNMRMKNDLLSVDDLHFKALDGNIISTLTYRPTAGGYQLDINAGLHNIDMSRALLEWNDFGQTTITSSNLKGRATAELDAQIHLNKDRELVMNKLQVETNLAIGGGELIEFAPLLAMSRFISVDELNHVRFDTLRNHLTIKDSRLIIPKMSISSSILNVDVFGEHGFDLEMDYHVNLLLNDLLRRKSKKKKTFDGHEIIDNKGKTRLYLWIRGKPGNLKVGFDKREVRKKLKDDFKKEGETIKQLFKEDFGSNKKETVDDQTIQFKLEEEEEESSTTEIPVEKEEPKAKKEKKRGIFSTEPENEETEGGFEIEFDP